jgi:RNA polymerase sigma factor (sigma-70 family)
VEQGEPSAADHELLGRYLSQHDEAAFAAIVHRHGAMVLATCRRLLPCEQDAEDAGQATFLVLACRGATIRRQASLAGWLHGVACRVARKLRADLARRRTTTGAVPELSDRSDALDVSWREVQAILDEELERLPERYRAPIVLCYLEGQTRDEAARRLAWSLATLRRSPHFPSRPLALPPRWTTKSSWNLDRGCHNPAIHAHRETRP